MGNSVAGSAALQSLTFLGGESGGMNSINSLNQTVTQTTGPSVVNTYASNLGNAPQFYVGETSGPYKYLGINNKMPSSSSTSNTSSPNYLEYILIGGAAIILVVIISKNGNNE